MQREREQDDIVAPPQPGQPEQAGRILPLEALGAYLLMGGLFCVLATLSFLWLATAVAAHHFAAIDDTILTWAHTYWGAPLDQLMLLATTLGDPVMLGVLLACVAIALLRRGRWIDAGGLAVAGIGAMAITYALKLTYARTRPDLFAGPLQLSSYSFPSGHALGAIVCYGMLAYLGARLLRRPFHRAALILAAALLTLAIGASRIYFAVHFPTDVLGGFIAGAIWLVVAIGGVRVAEWHAGRKF